MDERATERWRRIEQLMDAALDLPPAERETWLRAACGDDDALHQEVRELIAAGERPDEFLAGDAVGRAANLIAQSAPSPESPPAIPLPGALVGPFRLVRQIGRGGMGTVYVAEREAHFRQRVALKLIRPGLHLDERLIARFVEERQLLADLEHPGIARLLDGGVTDDGAPWFAMEYVEGEPIDKSCDARRLPIDERLRLFCSVCDAVEYAHQRRVIHRDLKPTNILVAESGVVKLLDFGIAKLLATEGAESDLTGSGLRFLTPDYASPEQLRGDPASPESDVYSLGVLLYELLAGRRPTRGPPVASDDRAGRTHSGDLVAPSVAVLHADAGTSAREYGQPGSTTPSAIARARSTLPDRLRDRLHGALDAVVLKALATDPVRRYPSAGTLALDVRRHLEGLPVSARPGRRPRANLLRAAAVAAVLTVAAVPLARLRWRSSPPSVTPVLAVGLITDHRRGEPSGATSPVADLLATNLARIPSLRVVSTARLYELIGGGSEGASDPGTYSGAARRAGASMLVDGSLYTLGGDSLRLDLRRIDLRSGEVLAVHSIAARDIFALVDSGTAMLAGSMGSAASIGSVADVTTHSEAAYRFYQEGLRAHYRGDQAAARGLFEAALREDTTLAMASFYLSRTELNAGAGFRALERARRMASRASERERLIIQTAWAVLTSDPTAIASAQALLTQYPQELDGPLLSGQALVQAGDFAAGLPLLRRVVVTDSVASVTAGVRPPRCPGCDARIQRFDALISLDSLEPAEREAAGWTAFEPDRATAWLFLSQIRSLLGKSEAAFDAYNRAARIDARLHGQPNFFARTYLAVGDYDRVDRELREITRSGSADRASEAWWFLTLSLRQQGRLGEALEAAESYRTPAGSQLSGLQRQTYQRHHAQVLFELGRYRESLALFDSAAALDVGISPSHRDRNRAWAMALGANSIAALGDTVRLAARIDTVRTVGSRSLAVRDRLLHHHLRGLLLVARGDDVAAASEFRLALTSPTGYTRTHFELGRALLRLHRPRDAVAVLQPAVRSPTEGARLYLTSTERHALLAEAWDSAGVRDSALVHYRLALGAWERADPQFAERTAVIRARVRSLEAGSRP